MVYLWCICSDTFVNLRILLSLDDKQQCRATEYTTLFEIYVFGQHFSASGVEWLATNQEQPWRLLRGKKGHSFFCGWRGGSVGTSDKFLHPQQGQHLLPNLSIWVGFLRLTWWKENWFPMNCLLNPTHTYRGMCACVHTKCWECSLCKGRCSSESCRCRDVEV